jgi:hypothetical protein
MVVFEKLLINSGQFARNILAFLGIFITGGGMLLSLQIFRSAFNLGFGQGTPEFAVHYMYDVGIFPAFVTLILCLRDMKKQ